MCTVKLSENSDSFTHKHWHNVTPLGWRQQTCQCAEPKANSCWQRTLHRALSNIWSFRKCLSRFCEYIMSSIMHKMLSQHKLALRVKGDRRSSDFKTIKKKKNKKKHSAKRNKVAKCYFFLSLSLGIKIHELKFTTITNIHKDKG